MVKVEVEVLLYLRVCKSFAAVRVKGGSIQSGPPREGGLANIPINKGSLTLKIVQFFCCCCISLKKNKNSNNKAKRSKNIKHSKFAATFHVSCIFLLHYLKGIASHE